MQALWCAVSVHDIVSKFSTITGHIFTVTLHRNTLSQRHTWLRIQRYSDVIGWQSVSLGLVPTPPTGVSLINVFPGYISVPASKRFFINNFQTSGGLYIYNKINNIRQHNKYLLEYICYMFRPVNRSSSGHQ